MQNSLSYLCKLVELFDQIFLRLNNNYKVWFVDGLLVYLWHHCHTHSCSPLQLRVESLEKVLCLFQQGKLVTADRVQKLLILMTAVSVVIEGISLTVMFQLPIQKRTGRLNCSSCMRAMFPWRCRDFFLIGTPLGYLHHRKSGPWGFVATHAL